MARIWITWEKQRRNSGISSALGFQLHEVISEKKGVGRYLECMVDTLAYIRNTRPTEVAVQNPSMVLVLFAMLLKWFYKFTLIVDSHNAGIYPLEGRSNLLNTISTFIQKHTDYTIITNENLKKVVESNGGVAYVLPDKIPEPPDIISIEREGGQCHICFICTYAQDEPYAEVIKAAELIPADIHIMITGNYKNKVDPAKLPENVTLLGYLSEESYWATLSSSDLVMDLTTRDDCLVCGAYEGVSLQKPMILSNSETTRNYFYKGCVYVDSDLNSIANGIRGAVKNIAQLKNDIADLKGELGNTWNLYADAIKERIAAE